MLLKDNSRIAHNSWNKQRNTTIKQTIQLKFSDNVTIYRLRSPLQMYTGFHDLIVHCTVIIAVQQFHCSIFRHICSTNKGYNTVWSTPFLFAAYELSWTGASEDYFAAYMGRFEFMPGVEKEGSPVYRQAHSKEMKMGWGDDIDIDILLYRWESPLISSHLPHTRSGDEWLVRFEKINFTVLKAAAGEDPTIPPSTGWQRILKQRRTWDLFLEEPSVRCTARPAGLPPCSVRLKLSGLEKDFQGKCEGEYKDTGLRSMGRQVTVSSL